MANKSLAINFTIPVGSYLKLGYRPAGTTDDFTYVEPSPFYNQSPVTVVLDDAFTYEFELRTICGSCPGGNLSEPIYVLEGNPPLGGSPTLNFS